MSGLLAGCRIEEGFTERDSRRIGSWLARSRTADVVDAHVAAVASRVPGSVVDTDDVGDLRKIVHAIEQPIENLRVPLDR